MRALIAISVAALVLGACDNRLAPEPAPAVAPVEPPQPAAAELQSFPAEAVPADPSIIPAPVVAGQDLLQGLAAGGSATVVFDKCPAENFNAAERLGALMCGKSYSVFYEASTRRWVALGPNDALVKSNAEITNAAAKNPGPPPTDKIVVVWGLQMSVDDTSQVLLADGLPVGHLVHTAEAQ